MPTIQALLTDRASGEVASTAQVRRRFPTAEPVDAQYGVWLIEVPQPWARDLDRDGEVRVFIGDLEVYAETF